MLKKGWFVIEYLWEVLSITTIGMGVVIAFIVGLFLLMKLIELSTIKKEDNTIQTVEHKNIKTSSLNKHKRILIISTLESLNLINENDKIVINKKIKE